MKVIKHILSKHILSLKSVCSTLIHGASLDRVALSVALGSGFGVVIEVLDAAEKVRMLHELAAMIRELHVSPVISDCITRLYLSVADIFSSYLGG